MKWFDLWYLYLYLSYLHTIKNTILDKLNMCFTRFFLRFYQYAYQCLDDKLQQQNGGNSCGSDMVSSALNHTWMYRDTYSDHSLYDFNSCPGNETHVSINYQNIHVYINTVKSQGPLYIPTSMLLKHSCFYPKPLL